MAVLTVTSPDDRDLDVGALDELAPMALAPMAVASSTTAAGRGRVCLRIGAFSTIKCITWFAVGVFALVGIVLIAALATNGQARVYALCHAQSTASYVIGGGEGGDAAAACLQGGGGTSDPYASATRAAIVAQIAGLVIAKAAAVKAEAFPEAARLKNRIAELAQRIVETQGQATKGHIATNGPINGHATIPPPHSPTTTMRTAPLAPATTAAPSTTIAPSAAAAATTTTTPTTTSTTTAPSAASASAANLHDGLDLWIDFDSPLHGESL